MSLNYINQIKCKAKLIYSKYGKKVCDLGIEKPVMWCIDIPCYVPEVWSLNESAAKTDNETLN